MENRANIYFRTCEPELACKIFEEGLGEEVIRITLNRKKWFLRFETASGRIFGANPNGWRLWEADKNRHELVEVTDELHNNLVKLYEARADMIEQIWLDRYYASLEEKLAKLNAK